MLVMVVSFAWVSADWPDRAFGPIEGQIGKLVAGHSAEVRVRMRIDTPVIRLVGAWGAGSPARRSEDGAKNTHRFISAGFVQRSCASCPRF